MRLRTALAALAILALTAGAAYAAAKFTVTASEFDPANTFLVQAQWLDGIGCPTNAKVSTDGSTTTAHYTDAACAAGDTSDNHNQGLLLAKTGPTANFASAGADITGVKGITLTELGYDIRKPGADRFEEISWDDALNRIVRLMKDDRDKNFIARNSDGVTVNRWITTGFLAASATTNETAFLTYKVVRSAGMLVFDNQARV